MQQGILGAVAATTASIQTLPGYLANLDATTGTYLDTTLMLPATVDGTTVAGWKDGTGNGNNFLASGVGTSTGPTLKTNIQNGNSILRFNGTSNVLLNMTLGTLMRTLQPFTLYIAADQATLASQIMIGWNTSTQNGDYGYAQIRSNAVTPPAQGAFRRNADLTPYDKNDIGANFVIMTIVYDGVSTVTVYTNKDSGTSGTTGSNVNTINQMAIGALIRPTNPNGVSFYGGDFGQMLVYNQAHNAAQISFGQAFMATKWAPVPGSVGSLAGTGYYLSNRLSWTAATNAASYSVARRLTGVGSYVTVATGVTTIYDYDMGLASNTGYDYQVWAVNTFGIAGPTSTITNIVTSSSAFDPTKLGPISGWYKPDSLGLSNGTAIATNTDFSAAGNNFTQATGALQPIYQTNIQNSLGMALLNGTSQYWGSTGLASLFNGNGLPFAVFGVVKLTNLSPPGTGANRNIFIADNLSGSAVPTHDLYFAVPSGCLVHSDRRNDAGGNNETSVGFGNPDTNTHIVGIIYDGTFIRLFLDGTLTPPLSGAGNGQMTVANVFMGNHIRSDGQESWWNGYLGEFAWYPFAPNTTQVSNFFTYLQGRWATPTSTPSDPSQFAGYNTWFRDDSLNGLMTLSNGSTVGTWYAKNIFNTDLTNSSSVTYQTNIQNGRAMALFHNATNDVLVEQNSGFIAAQLTGGGSFTVWGTFQLASTASTMSIFCFGNTGTNAFHEIGITSGGAYRVQTTSDPGSAQTFSGGTADTSSHSFVYTYNGTNSVLYIDGVSTVTGSQASSGLAFTFNRFLLGASYHNGVVSNYYKGYIGEYGQNTNALTSTQISTLHAYQQTWWATP